MFSFLKRPPIPRAEVIASLKPIVGEERAQTYFDGLKRGYSTHVPMIYDDFIVREHWWIYDAGIKTGTRMKENRDKIPEMFETDLIYIRSRGAHESGASREQVRAILNQEPEQDVTPNA